ncbi:MAG: hypothetical protein H6510_01595 [Acidobacteria bacterium]|nr:hypothetical protein [Acidobacteriota bacterium]
MRPRWGENRIDQRGSVDPFWGRLLGSWNPAGRIGVFARILQYDKPGVWG